jgi:hypothetical protein
VFVFKDARQGNQHRTQRPKPGHSQRNRSKTFRKKQKSAAFDEEHKTQYQNHREIPERNDKDCLPIHSREIIARPLRPKPGPRQRLSFGFFWVAIKTQEH